MLPKKLGGSGKNSSRKYSRKTLTIGRVRAFLLDKGKVTKRNKTQVIMDNLLEKGTHGFLKQCLTSISLSQRAQPNSDIASFTLFVSVLHQADSTRKRKISIFSF